MMNNTSLQSILADHLAAYQQHHALTPEQARACHRIGLCRTAALGGEQVRCTTCDFEQQRYHSCRNRHCPGIKGTLPFLGIKGIKGTLPF
jgi:hypothetical protein